LERLRYGSSPQEYPVRKLGNEPAAPVAAARELREAVKASATGGEAETGLARGFVIAQKSVFPQYELNEGYDRGTIFPALDKPLTGVGRCDSQ